MQTANQDQQSKARRAVSGSLILAVGMVMLYFSWGYPAGTVSQMGPGFIPRVVGFLICVLSLLMIFIDVTTPQIQRAGAMHLRGLIFVSTAIIAFALLVDFLGLVPSMFVSVLVSMFADDKAKIPTALIYASLSTLAGWLLFLVVLELPIPAFWR